jgi:hypothetical protein
MVEAVLTAIHQKGNHPTPHQLKAAFNRNFAASILIARSPRIPIPATRAPRSDDFQSTSQHSLPQSRLATLVSYFLLMCYEEPVKRYSFRENQSLLSQALHLSNQKGRWNYKKASSP